jgi:hypothetical protein
MLKYLRELCALEFTREAGIHERSALRPLAVPHSSFMSQVRALFIWLSYVPHVLENGAVC